MEILNAYETLKKIETLLQDKNNNGRHLFLAYGYTGYVNGLAENIAEWLNKNEKRTLTMVIGLHQDRKINPLLSAMQGEDTLDNFDRDKLASENSSVFDYIEKLTFDIIENLNEYKLIINKIERNFTFDIEPKEMLDKLQERSNKINFYTYPGYHGKLFSIISGNSEDLESSMSESTNNIRDLIIGSANLSDNSFWYKTELNIYSNSLTTVNISKIRDIYKKLCLRQDWNHREASLASDFSSVAESRKDKAIERHAKNIRIKYRNKNDAASRLPHD